MAFLFMIALLTALSILVLTGSQISGISVDEELHMLFFRGLPWASDPSRENVFAVHGLSFQLLSHVSAVVLGIEPLGQVAVNSQGFAIRHIVTALLTIATALLVGGTVRLITASRLLGAWSAVALLAIPPFLGHGFFNPKDIPVAFGFTGFTFLSVLVLQKLLFVRLVPLYELIGAFFIGAFSVWIAVGTRFGVFYLLVPSIALVLTVIWWLTRRPRQNPNMRRLFFLFFGSIATGLLAVALTNPCIVANSSPNCRYGLELLPRLIAGVTGFPWPHESFLAGRLVNGTDPDFWYLPVALVAGLPIGLALLGAFGFVFFWENHSLNESHVHENLVRNYRWIYAVLVMPVVLQFCVGPLAAILLRSTLYDSQRQHLYVYPAVVIFSSLGLLLLYQKVSEWLSQGYATTITCIVALGVLCFPIYESLRLFPYTYAYVNPLATVNGWVKSWETDYWGTAHREALRFVPEGANLEVAVSYWTVVPYLAEPRPPGTVDNAREKYVIQWHRVGWGDGKPPQECELVHTVKRRLRGEDLPMAYVSKCPIDYPSGSLADYKQMALQKPYLAQ